MNVRYTTDQAIGAIPNGSRIIKTIEEPGDGHAVGAGGVVIGSLALPEISEFPDVKFGYFVRWDDRPELPVFVIDTKIAVPN